MKHSTDSRTHALSDFYCVECGEKNFPIFRTGSRRESGHLKKLYCYHCRKECNCAEVSPTGSYSYIDFKKEFELGRFVNGERVAIASLTSCGCCECAYNVNGKCWNASIKQKCDMKEINNAQSSIFY